MCDNSLKHERVHVVRCDIEDLIKFSQRFGKAPKKEIGLGMGGRSYSAPFQFFSFNPDGTFAGTVKIARNILLAADANSYTSTVSVEILDPNGNVIATLCGTESATRLFD